jgi:hypothetical protein
MMKKTIEVRFDVDLLKNVDEDQIEEWLMFNMGYSAMITGENPLIDKELEPIGHRFFVNIL